MNLKSGKASTSASKRNTNWTASPLGSFGSNARAIAGARVSHSVKSSSKAVGSSSKAVGFSSKSVGSSSNPLKSSLNAGVKSNSNPGSKTRLKASEVDYQRGLNRIINDLSGAMNWASNEENWEKWRETAPDGESNYDSINDEANNWFNHDEESGGYYPK
jgi:hypothetical protein